MRILPMLALFGLSPLVALAQEGTAPAPAPESATTTTTESAPAEQPSTTEAPVTGAEAAPTAETAPQEAPAATTTTSETTPSETAPAPAPPRVKSPTPTPTLVLGATAPAPASRPLTSEASVAYLKSSGSSNQETFKGTFYIRYLVDKWTHEFRVEGLNEVDSLSNTRTRERYLALEKTSWNFTPRDYLFFKPQYEKDQQSAYDYQALVSVGYGHQFLKTEKLLWNVDLGVGTRFNKLRDTGEVEEEGVGSLSTRFEWQFRPGSRFTESASIDAGEDSSVVRTRSALLFALTDVLGLAIAYETKRDNGPLRIDDSLLTVGLNFQLK